MADQGCQEAVLGRSQDDGHPVHRDLGLGEVDPDGAVLERDYRFVALDLAAADGLDPGQELTVLQPAELELSETTQLIFDTVERLGPARVVIDSLSEPFDLGEFEARIGASIGIAVGPRDGTTAEVLIKNADIALYRAKADGRGTYRFYTGTMAADVRARVTLDHQLRAGIALNQFFLLYQPQVDIEGRVVGVEALVRWHHPTRGIISPVEFIPLAEETGLIVPLGV